MSILVSIYHQINNNNTPCEAARWWRHDRASQDSRVKFKSRAFPSDSAFLRRGFSIYLRGRFARRRARATLGCHLDDVTHRASVPRARCFVDTTAARPRGKWRAAAAWNTSLIWACRSRTSGGSERKKNKTTTTPVHTDELFSFSAEEVSHQFKFNRSGSSCSPWGGKRLKLSVARKLRERHLLPPRAST